MDAHARHFSYHRKGILMNKPWIVGLVGLCMAAFGAFGIRVVAWANGLSKFSFGLPVLLLAFGLFAFVLLMGLWSLVIASARWNDDRPSVYGFLLVYRNTWRRFTNQKWLLVLACSIVLINILGRVTEYAVQRYYIGNYAEKMVVDQEVPIYILIRQLPNTINDTLCNFLPDPGLSSSIILALCVLALLPWTNRRLASLPDRSSNASAIRFFRKLILPIGILAVLVVVGGCYGLWQRYSTIAAQLFGNRPAPSPSFLMIAFGILSSVFNAIIVTSLLVGGLAGSLTRIVSGRLVDGESFLEDSVSTFSQIAGIFLLINVILMLFAIPCTVASVMNSGSNLYWYVQLQQWFALVWGPLMVVLMFSPYAVSAGAVSMWQGLRASLDAWRNCGYNLLSFTALGIAIVMVMLTASSLFYVVVWRAVPYLSIASVLFAEVFLVAVKIMMAVAVWECYWQIRHVASSE